jgi:hypothetical protein
MERLLTSQMALGDQASHKSFDVEPKVKVDVPVAVAGQGLMSTGRRVTRVDGTKNSGGGSQPVEPPGGAASNGAAGVVTTPQRPSNPLLYQTDVVMSRQLPQPLN